MPRRSLLALSLVSLACKEERLVVESGLPDDKQGSALTEEERAQLCAAGDRYLDAQFTAEEEKMHVCVGLGLSYDLSVCPMITQECLASGEQPKPRKACADPLPDWSQCDATVAELEACWTEVFEAIGAEIEARGVCKPADPVEISAECERIESDCLRRPPVI